MFLVALQARKGRNYFTEEAERVEYGKWAATSGANERAPRLRSRKLARGPEAAAR